MAIQESWGEAFDSVWDRLGGGEGLLSKLMRYGLIMLLLAGVGWQGKSGYDTVQDLENSVPLPSLPVDIAAEQGRIDDLRKNIDAVMTLRNASAQSVAIMTATNRQPYRANVGETAAAETYSAPEALPPVMTVRSIMILGEKRAAVMDIETDGTGIIVVEGTKFAGGDGRILKIGPNKVVAVWLRKRLEIPLDQP